VITFDATYDPADDKLRSAPARASTPRPTKVKGSGSPGSETRSLLCDLSPPVRSACRAAGEIDDEKLSRRRAANVRPILYLSRQASRTPSKLASQFGDRRRHPLGSPSLLAPLERHARRDARRSRTACAGPFACGRRSVLAAARRRPIAQRDTWTAGVRAGGSRSSKPSCAATAHTASETL